MVQRFRSLQSGVAVAAFASLLPLTRHPARKRLVQVAYTFRRCQLTIKMI